jgi:hypothetical protein
MKINFGHSIKSLKYIFPEGGEKLCGGFWRILWRILWQERQNPLIVKGF